MSHAFRRVSRQDIDGEYSGKTIRMGSHGIRDVGIVVAIAGRCLDERGLGYTRFVHGSYHLLRRYRPRPRPVGLMTAQRRQGIALVIIGDDMRMDIDDG